MTTREQTREAVKAAANQFNHMISAVRAADAASDVWEAKVQEVLDYVWHDEFPIVSVIESMLEGMLEDG